MLTIAWKNYELTLKAQEQLLLNELKWSLMNDDDNVDSEEDDGDGGADFYEDEEYDNDGEEEKGDCEKLLQSERRSSLFKSLHLSLSFPSGENGKSEKEIYGIDSHFLEYHFRNFS